MPPAEPRRRRFHPSVLIGETIITLKKNAPELSVSVAAD
jgi:hypothetical protein